MNFDFKQHMDGPANFNSKKPQMFCFLNWHDFHFGCNKHESKSFFRKCTQLFVQAASNVFISLKKQRSFLGDKIQPETQSEKILLC